MKFSIQTSVPISGSIDFENDSLVKCKVVNFIEFDTDWFVHTVPSINDTHLFIPSFLDPDEASIELFFLSEYSKELLLTNDKLLCDEAKLALKAFNNNTYMSELDQNLTKELDEDKYKDVPF